jgi:hypothetical protein
MHDTPLPGGIGEELGGAFRKSHASVRDNQPDAVQPAFLEMFEEAAPTRFVLFGAALPRKHRAAVATHSATHALGRTSDFAVCRFVNLDRPPGSA